MIVARIPSNIQEIKEIQEAMPVYWSEDYYFISGLWKDSECIGGWLMCNAQPSYLITEFKSSGEVSLGTAIKETFNHLFKLHPVLNASIKYTNRKSLKFAKKLGFTEVYKEDTNIVVQLSKHNWKYKGKLQLDG